MKKSLIALTVISALSAQAHAAPIDKDGKYIDTAKDLIGALSYTDKQEYIAQFKTMETKQEQAAFFKMLIVAETSVENAINFALNGENGAVVEAFMIESGLLKENENGRLVIQEESDAYIALSAKRSELFGRHVQYDDNDDFYISPVVDDNEREMPDVGVSPIDIVITPVEPVSTEKKVETVNKLFSAAGLDSTIDGTTITFVSPSTGITTSYDLATLTAEQLVELKAEAKSVFKQGIDDRRVNAPIVEPIDPGFGVDPIDVVIEPIDPGFGVDPIDVVIEPIDPGFGVDPIDVIIDPINPGVPDPGVPVSTDVKVSAFNKAMEKAGNTAQIHKDPITGEYTLYREGEAPLALIDETAVKNAMRVVALTNTDGYEKVLQEIHDRQEVIVDPIDVVITPIDPGFGVDPKPGNPAPHPGYSTDVKVSAFNKAMERKGSEVQISKTVDAVTGEATYHFIQEGSAPIELTVDNADKFKKALAKATNDHRSAKIDPIDPGFGGDPDKSPKDTGIDKILNEFAAVNSSIEVVANSAANNSMLIATNSANQAATNDALQLAGQELQAKTGKAVQVLETARNGMQSGVNELHIAADSMKTSLTTELADLQAQIDRLNSGDDGTNPPVQDVELREGLQAAGAELAIKGADARAALEAHEQAQIEYMKANNIRVEEGADAIEAAGANLVTVALDAKSALEEHEQAQTDYMKASNAALGNDIQSNQIAIVALADNDIAQNERMDTAEDVLVSSATDMKVSLTNQFASIDSSIQVVANSAANNSVLIADVTATQSAFNVALQEASQTLQAKTGKAVQVLETARNGMQSGVNELHIAADSMKTSLTTELADLQAQIDRLNSGDDGTNPPTVDEELRAGLVIAKDKVETELAAVNGSVDIVANSAANNSMLIATNSANQAATNDALQLAGQELQAKTGKAVETLETARSGMNAGANELMAALQSMQAQMDAQARLIAELQAGENPGTGLPTSIDQDVRDGLQTASATMQKKLGTAADMLKTASNGLKNNKPQNGVQPIQPVDPVEPVTPFDPKDHEYGSVGNGAATAWLNERVDAGKGLMNDQFEAEFTAFEDKITAMYQSDMAAFQEGVQDEMDGVMASTHAITNSRPFLSNGGTAIGVGVGAAGDASAVAIGVAHSFVDTGWSVSGSVNATTGSSSDVSFGAGVQYQY